MYRDLIFYGILTFYLCVPGLTFISFNSDMGPGACDLLFIIEGNY